MSVSHFAKSVRVTYSFQERVAEIFAVSRRACLYMSGYVCVSASSRLNISETKGDSGLFPIGNLWDSA